MTMQGVVSVPAATAVAGYDLFRDATWRVSALQRIIRAIRVAGSAGIGDCYFDLFVGEVKIGRYYNLALAWPTADHEIKLGEEGGGVYIPPGETISAIQVVAPTTNAINVILR